MTTIPPLVGTSTADLSSITSEFRVLVLSLFNTATATHICCVAASSLTDASAVFASFYQAACDALLSFDKVMLFGSCEQGIVFDGLELDPTDLTIFPSENGAPCVTALRVAATPELRARPVCAGCPGCCDEPEP